MKEKGEVGKSFNYSAFWPPPKLPGPNKRIVLENYPHTWESKLESCFSNIHCVTTLLFLFDQSDKSIIILRQKNIATLITQFQHLGVQTLKLKWFEFVIKVKFYIMFPDLSFLERKVYRQIIRKMRSFHKYCVDVHKKMIRFTWMKSFCLILSIKKT